MKFCKNCGEKLDEKVLVCPKCGAIQDRGIKYCAHCGKEVDSDLDICPYCGCYTEGEKKVPDTFNDVNQNNNNQVDMSDAGFGLKFASFLVPIVGLVLFFVYKNSAPFKAKTCLREACFGIIASFILTLIQVLLLS